MIVHHQLRRVLQTPWTIALVVALVHLLEISTILFLLAIVQVLLIPVKLQQAPEVANHKVNSKQG